MDQLSDEDAANFVDALNALCAEHGVIIFALDGLGFGRPYEAVVLRAERTGEDFALWQKDAE